MNINIDTGVLTSTGKGQPIITKTSGNPFDFTVRFQKPHDGITKIALQNAQIPVGFYNIRAPYNTITVCDPNVLTYSHTYTVPPGNYTIESLITVLNQYFGPDDLDDGIFSILPYTHKIYYTGQPIFLTTGLAYPSLANLLGYTSNGNYAQNVYNINIDTYINIYLDNIGRPSIDPSKCTFKIPVSGSVIQWAENNQDDQSIQVRDNSSVDRLIVAVYDRFGFLLDNNGLDWSFTLRITSTN
jgi:hypothetical protein